MYSKVLSLNFLLIIAPTYADKNEVINSINAIFVSTLSRL